MKTGKMKVVTVKGLNVNDEKSGFGYVDGQLVKWTKMKRTARPRKNRITGEPKRWWKCQDNRTIDELLDCLEVLYNAYRTNRFKASLNQDVSEYMLECLEKVKEKVTEYTVTAATATEFPRFEFGDN